MTDIFVNGILIALLGILCVSGNRRAKMQDRKLAELYGGRIESVLDETAVEQEMLFAVLDRVARFGQEVDQEFQRLEDRLRAHEASTAQVATELAQLKRPRVA